MIRKNLKYSKRVVKDALNCDKNDINIIFSRGKK
nr:MAG TPA_asm: hypothetical protein [Caudoviricetes sp.]